MKCIFIGNPVPTNYLVDSNNPRYSIADNIAQNNLIEGLWERYGDDFSVLTVADQYDNPKAKIKTWNRSTSVVLDCGITAKGVSTFGKNRFVYYLSILLSYMFSLLSLLHSLRKENKGTKFLIITSGPYIFRSFSVVIARLFYKICFVPFIVACVEHPDYRGLSSLVSKVSVLIMRIVDGTIVYSEKNAVDYTSKPHLEILYSIDKESVEYMNSLKNHRRKKGEKLTIAYTGALIKIKGIDRLIEVIKKSNHKFKWLICGIGEYENEIAELHNGEDVIYYGQIHHRETMALQKKADILICLQSLENDVYRYYATYAATGKLTEYLFSGTPVVGPDIPSYSNNLKKFISLLPNQEADR